MVVSSDDPHVLSWPWEALRDERFWVMGQLGIIAHERRDFAQAEKWYRKSLAISEKLGDEPGAASSYHQLGMDHP